MGKVFIIRRGFPTLKRWNNDLSRKCLSTAVECNIPNVKATPKLPRTKNTSYTIPSLTRQHLNEVSSITGISIGTCYLSWVKFTLSPVMTVLDWNAKVLPEDFRFKANEPDILKYAYSIRSTLPTSDLYVMETFSIRGKELHERINEIHLSSMLIVLLNGINKVSEPEWTDKVVLQKKNIMNDAYGLLIGSERVSPISIVENLLKVALKETSVSERSSSRENSKTLQIQSKCLDIYKEACPEKKKELATVFLLTTSFIDINISKRGETFYKINKKRLKEIM